MLKAQITMITDKFQYHKLNRIDSEGKRLYECPDGSKVASVTRILSATKDQKYLDLWKKRVGEKKAEQIRNEAATVGTFMHKCIECHILQEEYAKFNPYFAQAQMMGNVIIEQGLNNVSEIWGTEVMLYYPGQYAGTTDLVGVHEGVECIMDFKQTNKPKKRAWVGDYFCQLAAYAQAHNKVYGTNIRKGVIFMCSRDYQYQQFDLEGAEFDKYSKKWFKRVEEFYENK